MEIDYFLILSVKIQIAGSIGGGIQEQCSD